MAEDMAWASLPRRCDREAHVYFSNQVRKKQPGILDENTGKQKELHLWELESQLLDFESELAAWACEIRYELKQYRHNTKDVGGLREQDYILKIASVLRVGWYINKYHFSYWNHWILCLANTSLVDTVSSLQAVTVFPTVRTYRIIQRYYGTKGEGGKMDVKTWMLLCQGLFVIVVAWWWDRSLLKMQGAEF